MRHKGVSVNLSRRDAIFLRQQCTQTARTLKKAIASWSDNESPYAQRLTRKLARIERLRSALNEAIRS